mgnify:CR=1 FL=1
MKLIAADDSRLVRGIIEKTVASIGYQTMPADNGREALNILETDGQDIKLVLLDWNMPVLNGIDVIKSMRGDERFKSIPVLMVSTETEDDKIKEALSAGAQGYLAKPFTPNQLIEAIRRVLEHK